MRRNPFTFIPLLVLTLTGAAVAHGADYRLTQALTIMEEFNDNIYESRRDRKADLITRLSPKIGFNYADPLWRWDMDYSPEYRNYARGTHGDQLLQNFHADGTVRLINNFLFLSVSDSYTQAPLDGNRSSLFTDQTNQNIFRISPYIQYRLDPRWTMNSGYRYLNRHYSYSDSIDNQEHGLFLKGTRELSSRASLFMDLDYARVYTSNNTAHERLTHTIGSQYRYAVGSALTTEGGYSILFPSTGGSKFSPYWNIGLIHIWKSYTFSLNSGVSYDTETGLTASERRALNGRLVKAYRRSSLALFGSYNETLNSQTRAASSRWFTMGTDATYDISRRATAHALIATDSYLGRAAELYRNSFTAGIRYDLYYDLFTGLDYNRIAHSNTAFSPTGPIEVNRIMVYLTKSFGAPLFAR